jgi:hypothetical protein
MAVGPNGEHRPADLIGCAIVSARLATGEIEELLKSKSGRTRSGKAGAKARADKLTKQQRSDIAKKAAKKRWG